MEEWLASNQRRCRGRSVPLSREYEDDRVPRYHIKANWAVAADEPPEKFEDDAEAVDGGQQEPAGDYLEEQDSDGSPTENLEATVAAA